MGDLIALYVAHPLWVWLALAAILLSVEILGTGTGWLLWAAASAAATGFLTKIPGMSFPSALVAFAVLTAASSLLARRYMPAPPPPAQDINDGVERLLGQRGRVIAAFQNGEGRVLVDGKEWAAEADGGADLAAGASVRVTAVMGAKLSVTAA